MTTETTPKQALPAYISFSTLTDILDKMAKDEPPSRIDRSYLDNYSGGYVSQILSTLEWLGLIDSDGKLTDALRGLIKGDDERKAGLATILAAKYPKLIKLAETNTTQRQFEEAIRAMGPQGETVRKAGAFYLSGAKYAEIKTGKLWKTPAANRKKRTPTAKRETARESSPGEDAATGDIEAVTISLTSGATLTLGCSAPTISLPRDDRDFVFSIVDSMREYEGDTGSDAVDDEGDDFED